MCSSCPPSDPPNGPQPGSQPTPAATPPRPGTAAPRALPTRLLVFLGVALIKLYQVTLSPFLGGHCRFIPTCSHYGVEALRTHGPFRGTWLTIVRLSRCHPFSGRSGYDPVPLADEKV
jgi:uncharacterized protein